MAAYVEPWNARLGRWLRRHKALVGTCVAVAVVVLTLLVALPIGILVLTWLNTMRLGRPRFHVSLLFVVGYILLLVTGAANAIGAATDKIQSPSAWTTGNLHVVAVSAQNFR